jgi:hypothetical protein
LVIVGNDNYVDRLKVTTDWFMEGFITGFTALVCNDAHISTSLYPTGDQVMMVFNPYPNQPIIETIPRGDATHFVSVALNHEHYGVLYYNITNRKVTVFDGLNKNLKTIWTSHIIHTIKSYGLELAHHECTTNFVDEKATDKFGRNHIRIKLEIYFHPLLIPWIVTNEHTYTQKYG